MEQSNIKLAGLCRFSVVIHVHQQICQRVWVLLLRCIGYQRDESSITWSSLNPILVKTLSDVVKTQNCECEAAVVTDPYPMDNKCTQVFYGSWIRVARYKMTTLWRTSNRSTLQCICNFPGSSDSSYMRFRFRFRFIVHRSLHRASNSCTLCLSTYTYMVYLRFWYAQFSAAFLDMTKYPRSFIWNWFSPPGFSRLLPDFAWRLGPGWLAETAIIVCEIHICTRK